MNLRPHHLLCIQKFTGHGYDAAFTRHMTAVADTLRALPGTEICLTCGCDFLCSACPNNAHGQCDTPDKVEAMDAAVLSACGLEYGQRLDWAQLSQTARERIFDSGLFENICQCCQWFELCLRTPLKPGN